MWSFSTISIPLMGVGFIRLFFASPAKHQVGIQPTTRHVMELSMGTCGVWGLRIQYRAPGALDAISPAHRAKGVLLKRPFSRYDRSRW